MLAGDFNMPETSTELTRFKDDGGFLNAFRLMNPQAEVPLVYQRIHSSEPTVSRRVDFIWLLNSDQWTATVRCSRIVLNRPERFADGTVRWPSDHYGVLADLDIIPISRTQAAIP